MLYKMAQEKKEKKGKKKEERTINDDASRKNGKIEPNDPKPFPQITGEERSTVT